MFKRVVLLNGPPGSGKDTIANACKTLYNAHTAEFKGILYQHTADLFKMPVGQFRKLATCRETKEAPIDLLQGYTPRQAMIFTSEDVYKKIYGREYFGMYVAKGLHSGITFISDAGFIEEALAVIKYVGANNVIHIKLFRDGCSFDGDSRSYYDLSEYNVMTTTIWNHSTIERIMEDMQIILNVKRWLE